jgi:predicted HTH transcriptional regulator
VRYHKSRVPVERDRSEKGCRRLAVSLWETYSAFANTLGGYILLGIEELPDKSFRTVGLSSPEKLVSEFWSIVNNQQKVNVNILTDKNVQIVEVDGNRIVVIEVPRADRRDKPVYINNNPLTGAYRRNGEGDYHCTKEEVQNMLRDQADVSQDLRVLDTMSVDAFDYDSIKRYRMRISNQRSDHVWRDLDDISFLHKLGAVGRAGDGSLHPTAAGILMFGFEYEIVREFPNYFLDYQEHENDTTRWTDRIISSSGDWSGNIFDFYFRVYNRITQEIKTPFKLENGTDRIDDTPVHNALREALANALIHANYYDRRGLVIQRYRNKIVIANPGSLRISVDDAISGGISDPRNATLIKMFNLAGIGERAGSGIPNIYMVWESQGWTVPTIEEQFNPDRTILSLDVALVAAGNGDKTAIKSGDKKTAIIEYLTDNVTCKASDISALLGLKPSRTRAYLSELIAENLVVAEGANRNRTYRLKV